MKPVGDGMAAPFRTLEAALTGGDDFSTILDSFSDAANSLNFLEHLVDDGG